MKELNRVPRSKLYCLEPINKGQFSVESLTGYISRLAESHCVLTGELFADEISPLLNKAYLKDLSLKGGTSFYGGAHTINGMGQHAQQMKLVMEKLTGCKNLEETTVIRFRNILSNRGLLRTTRAWCPYCYQDDKSRNSIIYDRQIWTLQSTIYCPVHLCLLQSRCTSCERDMLVFERRTRPGYCSKCSSWLGNDSTNNSDDLSWRQFKSVQCSRVISNQSILTMQEMLENLQQTFELGQLTTIAKMIGVPKNTIWGWFHQRALPPLEYYLRVYVLYTDLKLASSFEPSWKSGDFKVTRGVYSDEEILYVMKLQPSSLRMMAKRIGCDRRVIVKRFPALSKTIVQQQELFKNKKICRRINLIKHELDMLVKAMSKSGDRITRKSIEKRLGKPQLTREMAVQFHIHESISK
ncbi:TniQ family protein [Paenibacillus alvei]|uniref:TniQ family protein n=1 Tax=Paenibacillus alvei TaxID=44250 RepID=A0ABT4H7L8_PAEAL|nr:TniQ family protein [Paenibacillus alvei]MCY9764985.1 TniQ family protein [Paenibacillus alvei]MCY9767471.1 TniQ family protein [Paenibacillus alvei]